MKGTIMDFLKLASENEELGREIGELAAKYDFEFTQQEELSEEELENVAGGLTYFGGVGTYIGPDGETYVALRNLWAPPPPTDPEPTYDPSITYEP